MSEPLMPPIAGTPAHVKKTRLIHDALDTLKAANELDERDDLNVLHWIAWYDEVVPDVHDIKILAGAMEIELHRRRGEQILREDEQRGRPSKNPTHRVGISNAETVTRSRRRVLASKPDRVKTYVKNQIAGGRVPSVRGAVRAATTDHPVQDRQTAQFKAAQDRARSTMRKDIDVLDGLVDGQCWTDKQLTRLGLDVEEFLRRVRFLPWLLIDRTPTGTSFTVDRDLRNICDGLAPRPELNGICIRTFLHTMRTEIDRRRKENQDKNLKSKWVMKVTSVSQQRELLDWIEQQIATIPL